MGLALDLRNIETFYGAVNAIKGISLVLFENEIRTVLGANGSGKTTILRTISGLMKPEKGTIEFMGTRIDGMRPDRIVRLGISHVPEGREVFPELSVAKNLMMGGFTRSDRGAINEDIERVFQYFDVLRSRGKQRAGLLSGGEQQMLAIARSLLSRPKLLLLDEPSLGLAPILVSVIFKILRAIQAEDKSSFLLVEQNANIALRFAAYGYILDTGRVVYDGACSNLLENEDVKEFYLGIKDISPKGYKRWKRKKKWR